MNCDFPKININWVYNDEDRYLWLASERGLYRYDTKAKERTPGSFNCLIRKIIINHDSVIYYGSNHTMFLDSLGLHKTKSLSEKTTDIEYIYNSINFEFASPYFVHEEALEYSFFLEGFDENWLNWTKESKRLYTNLREGDYKFHVKARNIFGEESKEAIYHFGVLAPWYRTFYAYSIYGILAALFILIIVKLYTRRLIKQKEKLEELVLERTSVIVLQKEEILSQNEEIRVQMEMVESVNLELEKLSVVASETDNSVIIAGPDGTIQWANKGFERMYEYNLEEYTAIHGNNLLAASAHVRKPDSTEINEAGSQSVVYECEVTTRTGKRLFLQTTLTPIFDDNGVICKYVAIETDITRQKEYENEILQQQQEILTQKEELVATGEQMVLVNNELARKNVQIIASINYAKLIQEAILPSTRKIEEFVKQFFILYKPKDIVSGDFYWFSNINNKLFFVVSDCTGHGVPGAFMSMIGSTLLNDIINKMQISDPSEILSKMNDGVSAALNQEYDDVNNQDDGMDMTVCCIEPDLNRITFASASQYFYLIKKDELIRVEGSPFGIGGTNVFRKAKAYYDSIEFVLDEVVGFYMFTDGFSDQFGGDMNRKFSASRFLEILKDIHHKECNDQYKILDSEFRKWKGTQDQIDDVTVLGVRI